MNRPNRGDRGWVRAWRKTTSVWLVACLAGLAGLAAARAAEVTPAGRDQLRFRSGDLLTGGLQGLDAQKGLLWSHPDVAAPVPFNLEHVAEIRLGSVPPVTGVATQQCLVRLTNQDEMLGELVQCDGDAIVLQTWYAGRLQIPRRMVQLLQTKPGPQAAIFEGPVSVEGWTIGRVSSALAEAGEWHFKNGAFYATKAASVARNVRLPDVATLEFDLAWRGSFDLAVALYTDHLQPINLTSRETEPDFKGFYSLRLNNYYANILSVTKLDPIRYLGQVSMQPSFHQKNAAHVEIRVNKPRNLIALFIDGTLIKTWIDNQGFVGQGTGIRVVHQGQGATKFSGVRVTEWDGLFEEKPTNPKDSRDDLAKLRNGDRLTGSLQGVRDGVMSFAVGGRVMEVPFARVKQVEMAGVGAESPGPKPRSARGHFARGGRVTLHLDRIEGQRVAATSPTFGQAEFVLSAFERLEFLP